MCLSVFLQLQCHFKQRALSRAYLFLVFTQGVPRVSGYYPAKDEQRQRLWRQE